MTDEIKMIGCAAGCKRSTPAAAVEHSGWQCLEITGRWRCPACTQALDSARALLGAPGGFGPDPLSKDSIGALKKLPDAPPLHEQVRR